MKDHLPLCSIVLWSIGLNESLICEKCYFIEKKILKIILTLSEKNKYKIYFYCKKHQIHRPKLIYFSLLLH
jgi:hypothetical protein